jgi:hypothetical protein
MKKLLRRIQSLSTTNKLVAVAAAIVVGLAGYTMFSIAAVDPGPKLYLQPGSGTYAVGETIGLDVRLKTDGKNVNAVQADLDYPARNLRYVSIEADGSAFSIEAEASGGNGRVSIARGSTTGVVGDVFVAKVWFEVLGVQGNKKNNSITVSFADTSMAVSSADNQDILKVKQSGQYTIDSIKQPKGKGPKR